MLLGSRKTSKEWAKGLVNNLLTLVHKQCKAHAHVHERNDLGLKVKEGRELEEAITEQFELGMEEILSRDRHYI